MKIKISNEMKDKLIVLFFMFAVLVGMSSVACVLIGGCNRQAEASSVNISEKEQINKRFVEDNIKNEMLYNEIWAHIENMTDEEYEATFIR